MPLDLAHTFSFFIEKSTLTRAFLSIYVIIIFCRIYRSDKHTAYRAAIVKERFYRLFRNDLCFLSELKPVFGFITFFQADLQFCNKISFAMGVFCLAYIGSYACTASFKLICKRIMTFNAVRQFQDPDGKFGRKISEFIFSHTAISLF